MDQNLEPQSKVPFKPHLQTDLLPSEKPRGVFKTLQEVFDAFDEDVETTQTPYLVQEIKLPPIPTASDIERLLIQNALLLIDSGEYALARNVLEEVLMKNGKCVEAIRWMGWCCKQDSQLEKARVYYEKLIQLRSTELDFFELGEIYYGLEDDEKAIECWQRSLLQSRADSPHFFDLHKGLGNAYARSRDFESAEENYNKAFTIRQNSDALKVNMGILDFQQQKFLSAMAHYKEALEINPFNDKAWTGVALVAREMKDYEWAHATLLKALDINPANDVAIQILDSWERSAGGN